jgi:hypothetical protein
VQFSSAISVQFTPAANSPQREERIQLPARLVWEAIYALQKTDADDEHIVIARLWSEGEFHIEERDDLANEMARALFLAWVFSPRRSLNFDNEKV